MIFYKIFDDDLKDIKIQGTFKKIQVQLFEVMKFMFKTRSSHLLLSIIFNDKFLRSHLGILQNISHHENYLIKTTFFYYFKAFDKRNYGLKIQKQFFWSTLPCLHPNYALKYFNFYNFYNA